MKGDSFINLLSYKDSLRDRQGEKGRELWDVIRKKYVVLTPEELVRQLLIHALAAQTGIGIGRMSIERQVRPQLGRFDLVVMNAHGQPFIIAECKSHRHKLTQEDVFQLARYNANKKAEVLILTNGANLYCWTVHNPMHVHNNFDPIMSMLVEEE